MFEGVLEKILQSKLGKYLEGLDKQNLSFGIWSGNILLENVLIKKNIFDNANLPITLKFGKIRRLQIVVPWTRLSSLPVEIVMETLILIITPQRKEDWKIIDIQSFEFKKHIIDEFVANLVNNLKIQESQKDEVQEEGYMDRLLTKIIDNIQITIKNIHVRFEDKLSNENNPVSMGFTLKELSVNTTNNQWQPSFFDRLLNENKDNPIYKKLKVESFAIYVHVADKMILQDQYEQQNLDHQFINEHYQKEIEENMEEMFPMNADMIQNTFYLIQPLMLEIKMIQLTKTELEKPLIQLDVQLDLFTLSLNKKQYEAIFKLADYMRQFTKFNDKFNMTQKYKHLKPIYPIMYTDSHNIGIEQRKTMKIYQIQQPIQQIALNLIDKNQEELKQSEINQVDEDEFYDALDEILPQEDIEKEQEIQNHNLMGSEMFQQESQQNQDQQQIVQNNIKNYNVVEWWQYLNKCIIKDLKTKKGRWNEFKISNWRKKQYAKMLIQLLIKCISKEYQIEYEKLKDSDRFLYNHIISSNDVEDLKNWIQIVVTKKFQKDQEKLAHQNKDGLFSYLFSWGFQGQSDSNEEQKNNDDLIFNEEEIDTIRQSIAGTQFFDVNELDITNEEKKKLIKYHVNCMFQKGKILLEDKKCCIEFYQEDLEVGIKIRRDTSYELLILNNTAGINVLSKSEHSQDFDIVKPLAQKINYFKNNENLFDVEDLLQINNNKLWQLRIQKNPTNLTNIEYEVYFQTNPIKIVYDAESFYQITSFFKLDFTEEMKAKALDKIQEFKTQTQLSIQDLFYKRSNKFQIKIQSPILVIPFKSHNSKLIGEPESKRDRMWQLNLGNIALTSNESSLNQNIVENIEIYENFKLLIDSIKLSYFKQQQEIQVIEEVQLILDIGVKNKLKQKIFKNNQEDIINQKNKKNSLADILINAKLPNLIFSLTPDIYNSLVNLKEDLISVGVEAELIQLKNEKVQIIKNSIFQSYILTRGIRGFMSYWQDFYIIISGSYIYYYKEQNELMPFHYAYILDCVVIPQIEICEWSTIQIESIDIKNSFIIKMKNDIIYLTFANIQQKNDFIQVVIDRQQELKGGNIYTESEVISDIIHQDSKDLAFQLELQVDLIQLRIWNDSEIAINDQKEDNKKQWILGTIKNVGFKLYKFTYEIKLNFILQNLLLSETSLLNQDILVNEIGQNSFELNIDIFSIYSPNIEDSEIDVNLKICKFILLFDPLTINNLVKFFRNTRSQTLKDIESFKLALMNDEEFQFQQEDIEHKSNIFKQSCKTIKITLIKFLLEAQGVEVICIHHQYYTPFIEIQIGELTFQYSQMYDHDILEGKFSNVILYDLTNYPQTLNPMKQNKASINQKQHHQKNQILGIRDNKKHQQIDQQKEFQIKFQSFLYGDQCPLHKPEIVSSLIMDVAEIEIVFSYELIFRINDYFFDKLLWALTMSDYYEIFEKKQDKDSIIDILQMNEQQIKEFDLQQIISQIDLQINIHRPQLIIKDRHYSKNSLELDLGEIKLTNSQTIVKGRYQQALDKDVYLTSILIEATDLGMKYKSDGFNVSESFNLNFEFTSLIWSPLLGQIDSRQLDKSYYVQIDIHPKLKLNLRQDIYTYFCQCMDLNFAYTDYNESLFIFRNEEEYFKSVDQLLKSKVKINIPILNLGLYEKCNLLTEINLKEPQIVIDYFLNRRSNFEIETSQLNIFYAQNSFTKQLLFGGLQQKHKYNIQNSTFQKDEQNLEETQLFMKLSMFPNGSKDLDITITQAKLLIQPYSFLMLDHFFREGLPVYDMNSFDKPNEYDSDFETYPELHLNVIFNEALFCYPQELEKQQKTIAFLGNLEYEFKRETVKKIKKQIISQIESMSSLQDNNNQVQQSLPINWMRLQFFDLSPFICEFQDLELYEYKQIRKRQLISPFNLSYFYARCLQYNQEENQLINFEKSEIKLDKIILKISYNDIRLLYEISQKLMLSYNKFNKFFLNFKKNQIAQMKDQIQNLNGQENQELDNDQQLEQNYLDDFEKEMDSNFIKTTQKALAILTSYSMRRTTLQKVEKRSEINDKQSQLHNELYFQKINYDKIDSSILRLQSLGIQIVFINDYNSVFYPVLSVNIPNFSFKQQVDSKKTVGETLLKGMVSYFNPQAAEWEPLIEKCRIHLLIDTQEQKKYILLSFSKSVNINITETLIQSLIQTYQSLQEKEEQDEYNSLPSLRESVFKQTIISNNIQKQSDNNQSSNEKKVDFKVTPYTIINYTSKKITVQKRDQERNVHQSIGIPKEYVILPGDQIDYEVDYEEEARQLMRITRDELIRKHDFIQILLEDDKGKRQKIEGNLRDIKHYKHEFSKQPHDFIVYGVTFQNMRKILTLQAPFTVNNVTGFDYKVKLSSQDGKSGDKIIDLKPGQCYPISNYDMNRKFSICNSSQNNDEVIEWSNQIKIQTIIERLPKNTTTYLYHGKQFSIIIKEKSQFSKTYNINIKTPLLIKNALPCNLRIKTNIITNATRTKKQGKEEDIVFEYQQETYIVEKQQFLQLYNYNLKESISFSFTLDMNQVNMEDLNQVFQFQWADFMIKNTEFKNTTKIFQIKDVKNSSLLDVYAEMKSSKIAGVQITFYVKQCIINNTDQTLIIYYDKKNPAAGQFQSQDNSIILLSDKSKVIAGLEIVDQLNFSNQFQIDVIGVTNTIQIKKENNQQLEFALRTQISLASADEDIYTKITTISPCYVLNNNTKKTLLISQEECLEDCQIVLAGQRMPFFWKDARKPKLIKFKCVDQENAEYDDESHDWTFGFPLSELGKITILNRNVKSLEQSKYILIDKTLQESTQIVFVSFEEESLSNPTYMIENKCTQFQILHYQCNFPHHSKVLQPKDSTIFSWTNPETVYKLMCKFQFIDQINDGTQQEYKLEIELDNLDMRDKYYLFINGQEKVIYISVTTNGYTKLLCFSETPQKDFYIKKQQNISSQQDEEQKEEQIESKITFNIQVKYIGISLICRTFQGFRREFAYLDFENIKFVVIQTSQLIQAQLKVAYFQIDNNISEKQIFPVILYPKELLKRREQIKQQKILRLNQKKDKSIIANQDFFNVHFSLRTDFQNVIFFEKIEFLVQTMILSMDDELIGFIYKFTSHITDALHTNITGVHEVFKLQTDVEIQEVDNDGEDILLINDQNLLEKIQEEDAENHFQSSFKSKLETNQEESKIISIKKVGNLTPKRKTQNELLSNRDFNLMKAVNNEKQDEYKNNSNSKSFKFFKKKFVSREPQSPTNKQSENSNSIFLQQNQSAKIIALRQSTFNQLKNSQISNQSLNIFSIINKHSWINYKIENKNQRLYIKEYRSSPLEIEVSFITRVKMDIDLADKQFSLKDKLKVFGLALSNMDQAPLRINSLVISNIFGTPNEILFLLKNHYLTMMKKNLFTMIGSSNILGNPVNFVSHLGTGVQDFFYKPIEGIVKGPLEGGKGLLEGTSSLLQNTVQGTFGSASKILSSVSKGLLFFTDDSEYINKREEENMEKPKNALEGVGLGLKSTFTGIASGITGVFEKPIRGAQDGGVKGFFFGTYKGVSGLVVKPLSGALDFFSKTSEGIKNTASSEKQKVSKIRIFRPFYGKQQLIKQYDQFHSIIVQHLKRINRGKYQNDHFIDALYYDDLSGERLVIVLCEERLIVVNANSKDVRREIDSKQVLDIKKIPSKNGENNTIMNIMVDQDQEGLKLQIMDKNLYDRYFKKIRNYIFYIKSEY